MLNRLLGIIYILMNKGTVTAGELAERFEVSVRTIYRDVETLSMAGIPVYARKGKNGGISLTQQFVLDKMLVSKKEQKEILAALSSLQETGAQEEKETLQKLGEFFKEEPARWVSIDFSDWSGRRQELYEQLKRAILSKRKICFDYYGQYGEVTHRQVCPVQLLFKEYTWYLRGFCEKRGDMRLFKVLRMKRVEVTEESFEAFDLREEAGGAPEEKTFTEKGPIAEVTLWIDRKEAYRVYDRFEEEDITVLETGDFWVKAGYLVDDWVYGMILSFGPAAKVIEPEFVKEEIRSRLKKMQEVYNSEAEK